MTQPLTDDDMASIRETWRVHAEVEWDSLWHEHAMRWMVPALLAEVERLRTFTAQANTIGRVVDAQVERLREQHEKAMEIVQAVARVSALDDHGFNCPFCGPQPFQHFEPGSVIESGWAHSDDCPVTKARAIMEESPL